jgi:A/G-specific adenine glycosylase
MEFRQEIIAWYHQHKRSLPWRETNDPYRIWLSEIILQQTRVEQGLPYYYRFSEHYPTVADFAAADEGEILKDWQGLGYYSRARNMHHTAKLVMEKHQGQFPKSYAELIQLKGIGEYTAAAISSFSQNEAKAVLDGNVFRLLSRFFGIDTPINSTTGKKLFSDLANQLLIPEHAGLYNQSVMEFGALHCKPKNPLCETCPLQTACVAYQTNRIAELPVKLKTLKIRERFFNYVVLYTNAGLLMKKRGPNDIWQNLYDFPLFETAALLRPEELVQDAEFVKHFGSNVIIKSIQGPVKHLLSHQRLWAQFIVIEAAVEPALDQDWIWVQAEDLKNLAQPKLIFEFLINFFKLNRN